MISYVMLAVLCAGSLAKSVPQDMEDYSFSVPVGGGTGTSFATEGEGRITAVRVWERAFTFITGIQVRHGYVWGAVVGTQVGIAQELELFKGEAIVQVSGKYNTNHIYQLIFVTSKGRMLSAGHSVSTSFNMYPIHPHAELIMLSGRFVLNGITTLGAHWGRVDVDSNYGWTRGAVRVESSTRSKATGN